MKFKEALDKTKIVRQDNMEKLLGSEAAPVCLSLEKTIQEYWNVDRSTANFLNMLIKTKNVKSALEIGTSNGYSSIWLAKALRETGGKLLTIEYWQKRLDIAFENFKAAGVYDIITAIEGDAVQVLSDISGKYRFDFIFLDANKAEYIEYFNRFNSMLDVGGVIVADNILSHYHKTENYVKTLFANPSYQSQILDFDAGLLFSIKTK